MCTKKLCKNIHGITNIPKLKKKIHKQYINKQIWEHVDLYHHQLWENLQEKQKKRTENNTFFKDVGIRTKSTEQAYQHIRNSSGPSHK